MVAGHGDVGDAARLGLGAWLGRLLVADAAQQRSEGYWRQRQTEEEGTFAGILTDLAERTTPIVVHLANGRLHRGAVTGLGSDFAVIGTGERDVVVRLSAITSVRTLVHERVTAGDRPAVGTLTIAEALGALAEERQRVLLIGADAGHPVRGELRAVGRDVARVREDGGGTAYVALASVVEISAAESG
jgi:hypothetical protein